MNRAIIAQTITPLFRYSNYAEAALWCAMSLVILLRRPAEPGLGRRWTLACAITLFIFGASDVVEASTGAWWDPWWLLIWKGACLAVFLAVLADWVRGRLGATDVPSDDRSDPGR